MRETPRSLYLQKLTRKSNIDCDFHNSVKDNCSKGSRPTVFAFSSSTYYWLPWVCFDQSVSPGTADGQGQESQSLSLDSVLFSLNVAALNTSRKETKQSEAGTLEPGVKYSLWVWARCAPCEASSFGRHVALPVFGTLLWLSGTCSWCFIGREAKWEVTRGWCAG